MLALWLHANKRKQSSYWAPTTTLDSVRHHSSILTALKWAHIWFRLMFCFHTEMLLLSDSNRDKTCPGDPLQSHLIDQWILINTRVLLLLCTHAQVNKRLFEQGSSWRGWRRESAAPNSIQMSHTFSTLLINVIQLQHVLRNLDINSILMFKLCLNCAPISIQHVPN